MKYLLLLLALTTSAYGANVPPPPKELHVVEFCLSGLVYVVVERKALVQVMRPSGEGMPPQPKTCKG